MKGVYMYLQRIGKTDCKIMNSHEFYPQKKLLARLYHTCIYLIVPILTQVLILD